MEELRWRNKTIIWCQGPVQRLANYSCFSSMIYDASFDQFWVLILIFYMLLAFQQPYYANGKTDTDSRSGLLIDQLMVFSQLIFYFFDILDLLELYSEISFTTCTCICFCGTFCCSSPQVIYGCTASTLYSTYFLLIV